MMWRLRPPKHWNDSRRPQTGQHQDPFSPIRPDIGTPMAMAGLIWLCLLVVILVLVLPLFGGWVALAAAVVSLLTVLLVCFAVGDVRVAGMRKRAATNTGKGSLTSS